MGSTRRERQNIRLNKILNQSDIAHDFKDEFTNEIVNFQSSTGTAEMADGKQEVEEFMRDNIEGSKGKRAARLAGKLAAPTNMNDSALYARMTCWKGYVAKGKKKSPSGKKTKGGKIKMVNNCVKK